MSNDHDIGVGKGTVQRGDVLLLCRSIHVKLFPVGGFRRTRQKAAGCDLPSVIYATAEARDDACCPAPGAASPPQVSKGSNRTARPFDRTAVGLTPSVQASIKPDDPAPAVLDRTRALRALRWVSVPSDVPEDAQKERSPDHHDFRKARKGAPTSEAGTPVISI